MDDKQIAAQELQKAFGGVEWEKLVKDEITTEIKRQLDYNTSIILYGTFGVDEKNA